MAPDPLETVLRYHDRTKHRPQRYARGPGGLDWANQPDPFRRFKGTDLTHLPIPAEQPGPPYDAIFRPESVPTAPLTIETVSRFLFNALAISAWKQAGDSRWALRVNPSSGNLHPTEGYVLLPPLDGLSDQAGVYHYTPAEHALERRARLDAPHWSALTAGCPAGAWFVGLSSIHWREAWKYGERAFRYCQHDVGHALAALRISAAALGWRLTVLDFLGSTQIAAILGLDRVNDFADAEPEEPDLLAVITPAGPHPTSPSLSDQTMAAIAAADWHGRANRLSREHLKWEIIDEVTAATHKPPTAPSSYAPLSSLKSPGDEKPRPCSVGQVVRQRRSGVDFDGRTRLSPDAFYRIVARTVPTADRVPWDVLAGPPRIHLLFFVHLVDDLAPGVYLLARDPAKLGDLRQACTADLRWERPGNCPDTLPLFLLMPGDARRLAADLSLGQAIAGLSAFSLGMLAEFKPTLQSLGPWAYRRLFWEAGMVGQMLYLEAEAAGVRGTGIGAFFDDLVHDLIGLRDHRFQSLYHFTVGGPVEDSRITTLPAYPA